MKIEGFSGELHPGITMHQIPVQAGFPGLVFTIGVMAVYLMGIPGLIYFLALAIVLGIGVAVMLHFIPQQARFVVLVLTGVMIVCLAGIPDIVWPQELDKDDLSVAIVVPPRLPRQGELPAFQCDCHQHKPKHPGDSTTRRAQEGQKRPQPQSPFDGTWECETNDLPGVNLTVADAGGGQLGGVVTFYFQKQGDGGEWRVTGKFVAPLLAAHAQGKVLIFEVQHHKTHGSHEFGSNAKFRMELTGDNRAFLYNLSEPSIGPSKLMRQG